MEYFTVLATVPAAERCGIKYVPILAFLNTAFIIGLSTAFTPEGSID